MYEIYESRVLIYLLEQSAVLSHSMLNRSAKPSLSFMFSRIQIYLHQKGLKWEWEEWVFVMQGDYWEVVIYLEYLDGMFDEHKEVFMN